MSTKPFVAGPCSHGAAHPCDRTTNWPTNCLHRAARPTSSPAMRETAAMGDLRSSRPTARRPAEVHRLGDNVSRSRGVDRLPEPDSRYFRRSSAIWSGNLEACTLRGAKVWSPNLSGSKRKGRADQPQTRWSRRSFCSLLDGRTSDHTSDRRIGTTSSRKIPGCGIGWGRTGAGQSGRRGVFAVRLPGAVHQTALSCAGTPSSDGVRLKKGEKITAMLAAANLDPAERTKSGGARSREQTEPAYSLRHGDPFCLGHQLARHRGKMRAGGALFGWWPKLKLAVDKIPISSGASGRGFARSRSCP